ncbi:FtsX-like permease family protein [Streptomyces sp. PR69]|uniref:FtsX-like permease family protein n=1 Tax=Streptomyces sp. PR69 TaxID=2984950 RepID=UPI0022641CEF|nr:ABC transporter permease [Streptomyces sp. PR69]
MSTTTPRPEAPRRPGGWSGLTWRRDGNSLRRALPAVAVLSGLLAVCVGVTSGASEAVERDVLSSGGLTQIELSAPGSGGDASSARPLTADILDEAGKLDGVVTVVPDFAASVYAAEETGGTYVLGANGYVPGSTMPVVKGSAPKDQLADGQIIVPAKAEGTDLAPFVGKTVTFSHTVGTGPSTGTTEDIRLTVVAAYDPSWQPDGPGAAYVSPGTGLRLAAARAGQSPQQFMDEQGAQSAVVVTRHQRTVAAVTSELQNLGVSASPVSDRIGNLPGIFGAVQWLTLALAALLAAVSLLLGATRAMDSVRARLAQFAVLRVLGESLASLRSLLVGEAVRTGLAAGAIGLVAGGATAALLASPLSGALGLTIRAADTIPAPWWALAVLILPILGLAAGALVGGRRALSDDPYLTVRRNNL